MTLLVCSSCKATLSDDSPHCPRCGPHSLTFIISNDPAASAIGATDLPRRLVKALGSQYQVVGLLGSGGFAEVHEVRDTELQRRLAVKVLRPDIAWTTGMLARFKQEARAIARLNHPHTVPIHFVGEGEGLVFYVMPFVEGRPLSHILREDGAFPPDEAVALLLPVLDALEHAHCHGLVHRDIKPDNVMIEAGTGRPLLVDFGIAKSLDGGSSHTQEGFVVGTPLYMSPEQALGHRNVDARSDLYAVGAMLFQMLTGTPPFDGSSSQEIVTRHLTEPVPDLSRRDGRVPRWLSDIIIRAMAKQAKDRYPSAAAMADALRAGQAATAAGAVTARRAAHPRGARNPGAPLLLLATERVPAGGEATTARMSSGEVTPRPPGRRAFRPRLGVAAVLALLFAGGVGAAASVLQPRAWLVVRNELIEPVTLAIGGRTHEVAPGDSVRLSVPHTDTLHAEWRLVRPRSPAGRPLGAEFGGAIVIPRPRGEVRRAVAAASAPGGFFAPAVSNGTDTPIRLVVTGDSTEPCDCTVAPGEAVEHLGYYPLPGSHLKLTDSAGRTAVVGALSQRTIGQSGTVSLSITDATFHPLAPETAEDPAPPAVRHVSRPRRAAETVSADRKRRTPPPDPLRGIFQNR